MQHSIRIMLLSLLVSLLLMPGTSSEANAAGMFVGYDAFCGLPVVQGPDPQIATARRDQFGRPFIHIDPSAMANWSSSRIFTLAHECAHHRLGHTSQLGARHRYMGGTRQQELEADCWAARQLSANGYYQDITATVVQQAMRGHFAGSGYPSGRERATNVLACAGLGDGNNPRHCTVNHVPCNHPMHSAGDHIQCQHTCYGPYGPVACHPNGDIVHCRHAAHPGGHQERVCF
jgi:hypothetical protein